MSFDGTRSIWRETKMVLLVIMTGFINLSDLLDDYKILAETLKTEKRKRTMQLS